MQMDAYLEKEQIGTLVLLVGAPEGGFWGGVGGQGVPAQISYMPIQILFSGASWFSDNIFNSALCSQIMGNCKSLPWAPTPKCTLSQLLMFTRPFRTSVRVK